jgi:hypothetical protein
MKCMNDVLGSVVVVDGDDEDEDDIEVVQQPL